MSAPWDHMVLLLFRVWSAPRAVTVKSDFAREWANEIAEAAGRGFISTRLHPRLQLNGSYWRVTLEGLAHLKEMTEGLTPEDLLGLLQIEQHIQPQGLAE